jgi:hypothetical protein
MAQEGYGKSEEEEIRREMKKERGQGVGRDSLRRAGRR